MVLLVIFLGLLSCLKLLVKGHIFCSAYSRYSITKHTVTTIMAICAANTAITLSAVIAVNTFITFGRVSTLTTIVKSLAHIAITAFYAIIANTTIIAVATVHTLLTIFVLHPMTIYW